jgi:hypothetical protein
MFRSQKTATVRSGTVLALAAVALALAIAAGFAGDLFAANPWIDRP